MKITLLVLLWILAVQFDLGYMTIQEGRKLLSTCRDITKKFHDLGIHLWKNTQFLIIQILIHVELLVQDELLAPSTSGKNLDINLDEEKDRIYEEILYCSKAAWGFFMPCGEPDDKFFRVNSEKYILYTGIFNKLVTFRGKNKIITQLMHIDPVYLVNEDGNYEEFADLEKIVTDLCYLIRIFYSEDIPVRYDPSKFDLGEYRETSNRYSPRSDFGENYDETD